MFERYTEKARRAIFFARFEASQFGSPYIEVEHLLLGLMHPRVGVSIPATACDAIRAEVEKSIPRETPSPTSVDLPVSLSVKRTLHRAEQEADEAGQVAIGVAHLLLGLLAEEDSIVPRVLKTHGIDRDSVLREMLMSPPAPQRAPEQPDAIPPDRASLHALVDGLPDGAVQAAQRTLIHLQTWPPVPPPLPARIEELRKEWTDRARRGLMPGMMGGWGGGGSRSGGGRGNADNGRYSFGRVEDGVDVIETHTFRDGREITLTERFRRSDDGKTLTYTQEISGPGKSVHHEIVFDVS